MKNLLTIVVRDYSGAKHASALYDGIELIYSEDDEPKKDFVLRALKNATGKYAILLEQKFKFADVNSLINILDKNSTDMVIFAGGTAIKTSVMKTVVKDCEDLFSCFILSVLNCKTVLKSDYVPLAFEKSEIKFNADNYSGLMVAAKAFVAAKAKLSKDIYSHTINALCTRLVIFYMSAMVAIHEGRWEREKLIEFDSKLKGEIVLYLALEKNFTAAKLVKLRKKGFKISRLTVKKFKRILKAQ